MLQDVERDRPIELDALLTVTHDIGKLVGVPTPFIDSVWAWLGYAPLARDCSLKRPRTRSAEMGRLSNDWPLSKVRPRSGRMSRQIGIWK
jgi:Ketopantoate reductase PanE/ApbA C terminal